MKLFFSVIVGICLLGSLAYAELGLSELENKQPSPELFGYVIEELMRQKQINKS